MKQFVEAIFCPPNGRLEDLNLPSRLTDETFTIFLCYTINELYFRASFVSGDTVVPEEIKPFKLEGENEFEYSTR